MMLAENFDKAALLRMFPILVSIMLTLLTGLFSSSSQAEEKKLRHHQINLSGNIFHFSMPEDFSRDMPAADMVEFLDISDVTKFDSPEYGNLIRRWWDIKKTGWFGKQLGTVMMDISVQRVVPNRQHLIHDKPYAITDRLDFMLMLDDSFHQRYDGFNASSTGNILNSFHSSFAIMIGDEVTALQRDEIFNQQKWISYSIAAPRDELIVAYAVPLSEEVYLEAAFTYSHNDNVLPLEFRRVYAFAKTQQIVESFKVDYVEGNPVSELVNKSWLEQSNTDILRKNEGTLLKLFNVSDEKELPNKTL